MPVDMSHLRCFRLILDSICWHAGYRHIGDETCLCPPIRSQKWKPRNSSKIYELRRHGMLIFKISVPHLFRPCGREGWRNWTQNDTKSDEIPFLKTKLPHLTVPVLNESYKLSWKSLSCCSGYLCCLHHYREYCQYSEHSFSYLLNTGIIVVSFKKLRRSLLFEALRLGNFFAV